ncbi:MAG TPA: bifunctional acetate--CoA ligase family protein/GNAT family N-acetyltransferase [Burkholderiales bacterium]|nr:bifunctional acetate--CoA ligase family protein/GNAT family N-acetyltransferase [Burkholderiales bacterium]
MRHYLTPLFAPQSVALIGASDRARSVGRLVFMNLLQGKFKGKLFAVNPEHQEILGQRSYPTIQAIGEHVELAVIVTPPAAVAPVIDSCGAAGVKAAVIITAGFAEAGEEGRKLQREMMERAKKHGIRIVGPNCLGIIRPSIGLNATFSKSGAKIGKLALVSQSGALCTAILDWAQSAGVGFSTVVSMGDAADLDFGEILDYLLGDLETNSILLYIEGVRDARRFMSALRAAARTKPVVVIKAGTHLSGSKAAATHTGALVGSDMVFDAALRRAGTVRVKTYAQLFAAAEILASGSRPKGNRLAIVTNGGGPGVLAADCAAENGIVMANLSQESIEKLNSALPANWSHRNPVDIIGDANVARYEAAVSICLQDPEVDSVLAMLSPQAMTDADSVAQGVIRLSKQTDKTLLACWMGEEVVRSSRTAFVRENVPTFSTPENAVEAFGYLAAHRRNQELLLQAPSPLSQQQAPDVEGAQTLIDGVLAQKRKVLNEAEAKALLAAFRIPVAETLIARSPADALVLAEQIGFPVAAKIYSPDIVHKTDVGGVRLHIINGRDLLAAYQDLIAQVSKLRPQARIEGVAIEPMLSKPNAREVMIGVSTDAVFGPVISFGAGGIKVEIEQDQSIALPPLNHYIIDNLVSRTRIAKMLGKFRNLPEVNRVALENVLLRVSEMVCELPGLKEMDINPLIVDETGAIVADARVVVDHPLRTKGGRYSHMAIHPYPSYLKKEWFLPDATCITIRPIRPEDAEIEQQFVRGLSSEARYFRFFNPIRELSPEFLARLTQVDYDREMALIATVATVGGETEIGVARYSINPDGSTCEFAVVVADDWQRKGIGARLVSELADCIRDKGIKLIEGWVLKQNIGMLQLAKEMGFDIATSSDDPKLMYVSKQL